MDAKRVNTIGADAIAQRARLGDDEEADDTHRGGVVVHECSPWPSRQNDRYVVGRHDGSVQSAHNTGLLDLSVGPELWDTYVSAFRIRPESHEDCVYCQTELSRYDVIDEVISAIGTEITRLTDAAVLIDGSDLSGIETDSKLTLSQLVFKHPFVEIKTFDMCPEYNEGDGADRMMVSFGLTYEPPGSVF